MRTSLFATLFLCCVIHAIAQTSLTPGGGSFHTSLHSPKGMVVVDLSTDDMGMLTYAVARAGQPIISPSSVGINLAVDDPAVMPRTSTVGKQMIVLGSEHHTGVDDYHPLLGKTTYVHEPYEEVVVHTQESAAPGRKLDFIVRAYEAGAAFRMVLPQQPGMQTVRIASESTTFAFPTNYTCAGFNTGQFENSHEGEFDDIAASRIRPHNLYDMPLVCRTSDTGPTFAITESSIENYAGAYLSGRNNGRLGVEINLTPRKDDPSIAVSTPMTAVGVATPWRVILMADRPEKLIESNLVDALATSARITDTSWIQPGLATWDWWSGPLMTNLEGDGKNDATYKALIDFAAKLHVPYMLIDAGWNVNGGGGAYRIPGNDLTRSVPEVHLPELVAYAKQRHVGLWLWVNWKVLDEQADTAMPYYEKIGIRGVKADFIDREDQDVVDYYHRILSKAAKHHLMVDLHGAFAPRGLERTYPNLVTQEGVMGAEYNKWSSRDTASYNVRLAYTRGLLGPMDYTPGGYNNVRPEDFAIHNLGPEVMTTRAQQLAMYVVYTSWFGCIADAPVHYEATDGRLLPGVELFGQVPTSWDETRAVAGEFGKYIAVARRKGKDWYLGILNDETARDVSLNLPFLKNGTWNVQSYTDGRAPTDLKLNSARVSSDTVPVSLAAGGGAVLVFHAE